MIVILNEQLAVAGTLVRADMREIGRRGYQTLIDLRADEEPAAGGLSPAQVCQYAIALGLAYYQIPVTVAVLSDTAIETVRRTLREAQGPILLHCVSGRRASALALLHCSCEEGASVTQFSAKVQALGLDWDSLPGLRDFCLVYLIRHSPAHRSCLERADAPSATRAEDETVPHTYVAGREIPLSQKKKGD